MFETITIKKVTSSNIASFEKDVRNSALPYFPEEKFPEKVKELEIYAGYNDQGFCGCVAIKRNSTLGCVCPATLEQKLISAHRILGAYSPKKNQVKGFVPALADALLNSLAKEGRPEQVLSAVIIGQRHNHLLLEEREVLRTLNEGDFGPPFLRGAIHPGARVALEWAEKNHMQQEGFDPVTLGPVYSILAAQVQAKSSLEETGDGQFRLSSTSGAEINVVTN